MTPKDFAGAITSTRLQVLHDYGLYRHIALHLTKNNGKEIKLDITTAPGQLTVRGDTGPYFFAYTRDVFGYFRPMDSVSSVKPTHWERILISGNARHWCPHHARQVVTDAFNEWAQQQSCPKFLAGQLARLNNELKLFADDEHEFTRLLRGWVPDSPGILIHDLIDPADLKLFSPDFIFTCNAISWAVNKFDDIKQQSGRVDNHIPAKRRNKPRTTKEGS